MGGYRKELQQNTQVRHIGNHDPDLHKEDTVALEVAAKLLAGPGSSPAPCAAELQPKPLL
jgi:hypothetical protein